MAEWARLTSEFARTDRYWKIFYNDFPNFKSDFDACMNRLQQLPVSPIPSEEKGRGITNPVPREDNEPPDDVKEQVKRRDNYRCLCCGSTKM